MGPSHAPLEDPQWGSLSWNTVDHGLGLGIRSLGSVGCAWARTPSRTTEKGSPLWSKAWQGAAASLCGRAGLAFLPCHPSAGRGLCCDRERGQVSASPEGFRLFWEAGLGRRVSVLQTVQEPHPSSWSVRLESESAGFHGQGGAGQGGASPHLFPCSATKAGHGGGDFQSPPGYRPLTAYSPLGHAREAQDLFRTKAERRSGISCGFT